ncbi:hypothetical protein [Streptomyces sp. SP18CS02]|uniref:hypothetical protein n=1 Tax=Streptomyces sp. SP18CS02 TaxID=3002531 RepID=UPI002E791792|nr:hypothetical protein [Streptomyces sp. SP18CS02]MEE1751314.1 hypothetical protein [Streptomyces sp. SP18CS02]
MALLSAVATLLAALFLCLGPEGATGHHGGMADARVSPTATPVHPAAAATAYSCPYDRGDCGLFPSLTPAVLTAPPLDPPQHADGPARTATAGVPDRPARAEARPRAPGLHVLQVLRT